MKSILPEIRKYHVNKGLYRTSLKPKRIRKVESSFKATGQLEDSRRQSKGQPLYVNILPLLPHRISLQQNKLTCRNFEFFNFEKLKG